MMDVAAIRASAGRIRRDVIELAYRSRGPHTGSALSCVDLLATLYGSVLRLDPWDERDILILSKAHGAMALYATLAEHGIIDRQRLAGYCQDGGTLPGHLDRQTCPGVEVSAGSLGHGFSMGLGWALGFKRAGITRRVFAVIGDGESQEGAIWEGAMFAARLGLDNFTALLDYNRLQGYGRPAEVCAYEPIVDKWLSFGWHVERVDGHDPHAIGSACAVETGGRPRLLVADTIKGKGVSFMEDQLVWHYYIVTDDIRHQALEELD
jgi:transketolase